jgi:hypothetical protein
MSFMNFKTTEINIVVNANANNPSILNPDFLKINDIIAPEIKPIEFICTPPFAQIKFENKTSIVADTERLTFSDSNSDLLPNESPVPSMAVNYVTLLKHAPYTAVGINFTCLYDFSHMPPIQFLLNRFINREIWKEFNDKDGIGLKFAFNKSNFILNLDISHGTATNTKEKRKYPVIVVKSNFHCVPSGNPLDDIIRNIEEWKIRFQELKDTLERFFY